MNTVIAICENKQCETIFTIPNLLDVKGSTKIQFTGSKLGPCPKCGSFGKIPDGIYQMINNSLELIKGPQESIDTLLKIKQILQSFTTKSEVSKEEVIDSIQELSPTFAEKFSEFKNASFHTWIQTLIAIIGLAILIQQTYFKGNDDEIKDKIIYDLIKQNSAKPQPISVTVKIQRNNPCPCESGKKYKKCCLNK